jgi:hypothetical protein
MVRSSYINPCATPHLTEILTNNLEIFSGKLKFYTSAVQKFQLHIMPFNVFLAWFMPYIYRYIPIPMRVIVLLILLATIVLFACDKKMPKAEAIYCTIECGPRYTTIELTGYDSTESDTIRMRVFEQGTNFSQLQKDTMIYNARVVVYERMRRHSDYEVIIAATLDTFRLFDLQYSPDSASRICNKGGDPCFNSISHLSMTHNGVARQASYFQRYFHSGVDEHVVALKKP